MDIKPIPTKAFGITFRSRLEARWATYLHELRIEFFYEYEGFDLGGEYGYYLPDFWLPQVRMWAEVKPSEFSLLEIDKCGLLQLQTGRPCLTLDGHPGFRSYYESPHLTGEGMRRSLSPTQDYIISNEYLSEGRFYANTGCVYPEPDRFTRFESSGRSIAHAIDAAMQASFWEGT